MKFEEEHTGWKKGRVFAKLKEIRKEENADGHLGKESDGGKSNVLFVHRISI